MDEFKRQLNKDVCKAFNELGRIRCTFTNKEFKVDGDRTSCTISCTILDKNSLPPLVKDWIWSYPPLKGIELYETSPLRKGVHFKVTGTTVRAKDDKPNEQLGRRMAESKAKKKAYRFCNTFFNKLACYYYAKGTAYNNLRLIHGGYLATETVYREKLRRKQSL